MKNATAYAKKLRGLLRRTKAPDSLESEHTKPLDHMVYAYLQWETTAKQADQAYSRLMRQVVDHNDMRVSDPADLVFAIGSRYSRVDERAVLLRNALHSVYLANHAMSLESLKDMSKRDARAFLDKLNGMVPFVSASIVLHCLGGHAIPVDELLLAKLQRDGIVDEDASIEEVTAFLEHQVKAADGMKVAAQLRKYAETGGPARMVKKEPKAEKTAKKTTKATKTTKKSTKAKAAKSAKKTTKEKSTTKKSTKKKTTKKTTKKKTTKRR